MDDPQDPNAGPDANAPRMLDHFGLLLVVTVLSIVVQSTAVGGPLDDRGEVVRSLLLTVLVGAALILALRTAGVHRRRRRPAEIFIVVAVVFLAVLVVLPEGAAELEASPPYFWLALSIMAPIMVVRRLLQHRRVTRQTLYGSLSVYLLLAITFSFAFQTLDAVAGTPVFGSPQPLTSYMYFSLTTITTVGWGDLAAVTPVGRLVAVMEAVIGQVYLVTVVALVVGRLSAQPVPGDPTPHPDPPA